MSDKIVGNFLRLFLRLFSPNFQRSFTTRKPVSAKFYDDFFSSSQNRRRFFLRSSFVASRGMASPANLTCANFHKDWFYWFQETEFETDSDIVRSDTSRRSTLSHTGDVPPALSSLWGAILFLNGIKFMPAVKGEKCPLLYRNEFSRQPSSDTLHVKIWKFSSSVIFFFFFF